MQFINGKYANAYIGGTYYGYGKIANGWHDDGTAWYFFINGKKFTGNGVDGNGKRLLTMVNMLMGYMKESYIKMV